MTEKRNGGAKGRGPAGRHFVVHHSGPALTAFHIALQEGPSLSFAPVGEGGGRVKELRGKCVQMRM